MKDERTVEEIVDARTAWRTGEMWGRLYVVEKRAEWRARTGAYGCDRKLERKIARAARRKRKAIMRTAL